jgi:uncharacterized protein (TIGR02611 family)
MLLQTVQQAKRLIKIVIGFTLLLAGLVMLITPGPGWAAIIGGLVLLAAEFAWARWLLRKIKERGIQIRDAVFSGNKTDPPAPTGATGDRPTGAAAP